MDALDAEILLTLGIEPYVVWPPPVQGLRPSAVAARLGKNVQLVKDRMARMEEEGIIHGYRVFPNLRHCGLDLTTYHLIGQKVPHEDVIERVLKVDGVFGVVWFMGPDLCVDLVHSTRNERDRRLDLITDLAGQEIRARPLLERPFPKVARPLSPLDWRIIAALQADARRPLTEVAEAVGVTAKTVSNRLQAMRAEGSIDEFAQLDLGRMRGMIPFQLSVWYEKDGPAPEAALLRQLGERLLAHFRPPRDGYADICMRVFADSPAGVQEIVRQAAALPGIRHAEPMLAAGVRHNEALVQELIERHASGVASGVETARS